MTWARHHGSGLRGIEHNPSDLLRVGSVRWHIGHRLRRCPKRAVLQCDSDLPHIYDKWSDRHSLGIHRARIRGTLVTPAQIPAFADDTCPVHMQYTPVLPHQADTLLWDTVHMLQSSLIALLRLCDMCPQHMLYMMFALWMVGSALFHNRYTPGVL